MVKSAKNEKRTFILFYFVLLLELKNAVMKKSKGLIFQSRCLQKCQTVSGVVGCEEPFRFLHCCKQGCFSMTLYGITKK